MPIRVLLAPLFQAASDRRALDAAFALAERFRCHVDALLVQPDPTDAIPMVGEGVSADTIRRLMEDSAAAIEQQRQAVRAVFDEAVAAAEIGKVDRGAPATGRPSTTWQQVTGQNEDVVPERALFSDLVIFAGARSEATPSLRTTFEAVLLKARRPILLAPQAPISRIGHDVAIAWNGTPEARSALAAAMPFLSEAAGVHLLIATSARTEVSTLEHAKDYLAWHGIACECHAIEAAGEPVGMALSRKALSIGADLLVMGGYGHARLRERILGGVTHHIVNDPELPILLAH